MSNEEQAWLVLFLALYMLPAMVAYIRKHRQRMAITVLNLLAGWTAVGWLVAIVWACTADVDLGEAGGPLARRFWLTLISCALFFAGWYFAVLMIFRGWVF
jgi:hypothetical protein